MQIAVIGGGPAGLYFSILMKRARPDAQITVMEKNPRGVTWGWGVVFSDETLDNFKGADPQTHDTIVESFARWDDIDIFYAGEQVTSGGHSFCGLRRMRLLEILQDRAEQLGVSLQFDAEISDLEGLKQHDLVVAADGINSVIRAANAEHFKPDIEVGRAKFIWLGTTRLFDKFTFIIKENEHGLFQVHAYQFEEGTSTFIVECDEDSWRAAGLEDASEEESIAYCERLFAEELQGHSLMGNFSRWINFRRVKNERWHHENVVLIGDAAHTAHFSIGSGTKLAMEDAIHLSKALCEAGDDISGGLDAYYERRWLDVAKLQRAAQVSRHWFEDISRYRRFDPQQFAVSLLSRSKRITHGDLKLRDPDYIGKLDEWFARGQGWAPTEEDASPPRPMFLPFKLRDMELTNRVVVSPMCQYSATDGLVDDWHMVHLGSRAIGGAGLLFTEMTMVSADGRISPGCAGMYREEHIEAWKRITDFVHTNSKAKIAMQLGHAGRKGSTRLIWEGADRPLPEGNWPLISASAIPYLPSESDTPREMTREDMDSVRASFVWAARGALAAGFDLLELHLAHGYLLASFISPLTNKRTDEYGGALENRMRFPLEVFRAVREVWPETMPMSARISATDWHPDGLTDEDAVALARMLAKEGCDVIDVSAGQTSPEGEPVYGRMFQTPWSDRIRNEAGIATIAVGNIQSWDHVNTIIVSGRADLCALARPHLYDPYVTLHAAAEQGVHGAVHVPPQYRAMRAVADREATEQRELEDLRSKS